MLLPIKDGLITFLIDDPAAKDIGYRLDESTNDVMPHLAVALRTVNVG